jgi:Phage tail sheath C-terminal domain
MAVLVSPGVSISVIDQSINVGAGPGTVPLVFIATQENKPDPTDPTGLTIAPGTLKENAGKVWSITSQRDLVTTFGDPVFYSISGTSLNGYPLNEYGLLATYSYLGIANLARVVRADIDTLGLEATPIEPTSPAAPGTFWLDETSSGTSWGLFKRSTPGLDAVWIATPPTFVNNYSTGGPSIPAGGVAGDTAVHFYTSTGEVEYWTNNSGVWVRLGTGPTISGVVFADVWPDLTDPLVTQSFWVKTTPAASGANFVVRRMDATLGKFVLVPTPIFYTDDEANIFFASNPLGSVGQYFVKPMPEATPQNFQFMMFDEGAEIWVPFIDEIIGQASVPTQGPSNGQMWYNPEIGLTDVDGVGTTTVDILIANGQGNWDNVHLPGFSTLVVPSGNPTLYTQSSDPRDNIPAPSLVQGDIWVDTDKIPYPVIQRWNGTTWYLTDITDQTSPNGIIFQDARPNPLFKETGGSTGGQAGQGKNNGGGNHPDLDPDAPDSDMYPKGFLLWNTRYSTNNVKHWQDPFVYHDEPAAPDNTNNDSLGRWVTISGNDAAGKPYMGAAAQQIVIVRAIQAAILTNEDIRAEDLFYNLIAAPGFVEAMDEMIVLNEDRKQTAFVVGDTPFTLNASGTSLQNWATNHAVALGNGPDGLVSISKYLGVYYPSGLSTNVDGTDVVVPPSHMALRTIGYSDQVAYPWFAPAGLQRGIVNNAGAVGYVNETGQFVAVKLNEGQRDILYINGINPIRVMPQGGIVVFGQKTRQPYASATDRINVVRLENYLRYQFNLLAMPFLFEPNDSQTRKAVKDAFDRFCAELITLRALYDFLVVCDLSNNTPARIDRNELWIDVAIQPVKAIEFIYIPIRIKNTGTSLAL